MNQPDNRPFGNGQEIVATSSGSYNSADITGNVGSHNTNFQLRTDSKGQPVLNFSVCTDTRDNQGNVLNKEWHRVVVFGALAKRCTALLRKGRLVRVQGKIIYTKYQRTINDIYGNQVTIDEPVARILANDIAFYGNCYDVNFSQNRRSRNDQPFHNRGVNDNERRPFNPPQYPQTDNKFQNHGRDTRYDNFVRDDGYPSDENGRYPDEPGFNHGNGGNYDLF